MNSNDEPVFEDELGHHKLVRQVGHRILSCSPPYVIGVCGSWGAGKTSFLKMLWAYLGGEFEIAPARESGPIKVEERLKWFEETEKTFNELVDKRKLELVWFNPWQHQFESSPLVALLHEIRQRLTFKRKLSGAVGKAADVGFYAIMNAAEDYAKRLGIPVSAKGMMERSRQYDVEHFSIPLTSQQFREFFEGAIRAVIEEKDKEGLLVIFIDDLDRCEGDVAYRLMEALKLYINAANCVYVLGMDQSHLESSIAKTLSGESATFSYRPLARDYLNKMFQNLFLLPVPRDISKYIRDLLDLDAKFKAQLAELFGLTGEDTEFLVKALDRCLPHNPRKAKAFVSSWKLHLDMLPSPTGPDSALDWRLSLILHYLAQFEEPLFRKVEEAPEFYDDHIVKFCLGRDVKGHWLIDGLELPYGGAQSGDSSEETGAIEGNTELSTARSDDTAQNKPRPRIFWISRLINELARDNSINLSAEFINRHLVKTGRS